MDSTKDIVDRMTGAFSGGTGRIACTGVSGAECACLIARLSRGLSSPLVVLTPSLPDAERFIQDMAFFDPDPSRRPVLFPPYTSLPYKSAAYHNETAAARIRILYRFMTDSFPEVTVVPVEALLQRIVPKEALSGFVELLMTGEEIERDALISKLVAGGYERTAIVEEPGDFCVRGGILDVFSPMYENPLRIELFGDAIESMRFFAADTQRKRDDVREAVILPAREVILRKDALQGIMNRIRIRAADQDLDAARVREIVERVKKEGIFPGIEGLLPLIFEKTDTLFDYIPDSAIPVPMDPSSLETAAKNLFFLAGDHYRAACADGRLCLPPEDLFASWAGTLEEVGRRRSLEMSMLPMAQPDAVEAANTFHVHADISGNDAVVHELQSMRDREHVLLPLAEWIREQTEKGFRALLICGAPSQAERMKALLQPYGIEPEIREGFPNAARRGPCVRICLGRLSRGFVWPELALAVITEDEIFGTKRRRRKVARKTIRSELLALEEMKKGDFVVHQDHGIGEYQGLVKLTHEGVTGDYLLIYYQDQDRLYLPVERMGLVRKYVGVDGMAPVLNKMGGKAWEKVKAKAKQAAEKIAGELLELYATRRVKQGHAFSAADSYFKDFEAGFEYEETADQLKAIDDVIADMEASTPMDRLVCGDVGYGKTEVALRASFKAVSDGKQVGILVPTTVLAEQHYKTFSKRFEHYPIRIDCLNRFRSAAEQRRIVSDIKSGKTDIVVGTHRLLQKDVGFKDLGLLVLDEEQRFGVRHKESLKKFRETVDVLTLTATPIPRTLHMSLLGVRDISVITTPPEERHAIKTYIAEYDDALTAEAIRRELSRNGQIFFIHNNIRSIHRIAAHLQEIVPEVRLGVAHGQMGEDELERMMLNFMEHTIDMLVCTTIVESGLDIPSANTMLIDRADRFGLSQIYQLRGRVGRSSEQAYAYLFVPRDSNLTRDARKRLKVLMENSDLGSGFQIAMSDLQIRGGGSVLGISQSGHIAAIGYDMFLDLMERAVGELKGEPDVEPLEPEINFDRTAFIPESYIPDIDQRLSAYRRLARMTELKEIAEFKAELTDRFGALGEEANNLLLKIMLRILCVRAGLRRLDMNENHLALHISEMHQKHPFGLLDLVEKAPDVFRFSPDHVLHVRLDRKGGQSLYAAAKNILQDIACRVNG